jgi:cysteine synthase B
MTTTALPVWQVNYADTLPGDEILLAWTHTAVSVAAYGHVPADCDHAKAEWFNPSGSVKDRAAREIILTAEHRGDLTSDRILLDATSGNMGIAYATLGAARGYKVTLTMPANASSERITTLKALGVDLVLTDRFDGTDGAQREARSIYAAQPDRYFYADQYNNQANWRAHYRTTGPEVGNRPPGKYTFCGGPGHEWHHDGHRPPPEGIEPCHRIDRRAA